jgi:hypothetical protein
VLLGSGGHVGQATSIPGARRGDILWGCVFGICVYRSSTGLGANVSVCVRGYVYELRNGNVMGTLGEEKETETDGERGREGGRELG